MVKYLLAHAVWSVAAFIMLESALVFGGQPTPMYYKAEPFWKALEAADVAHDDKRAEELAREILKLPMDPAESEYLKGVLFRPLGWLRDHGRLEAWLADAEKELEVTPEAKHLQWFVALGWEYAGYFTHETFTIELGKATAPVWLRIRREGKKRTAAMSQDGKEWIEKDIIGWRSDKPFLWGFASAQIPLSEAAVPAAFQPFTLEPSPPADSPWIFEKPLASGFTVAAQSDPVPSIELRPVATRVDVLMDSGWLLHREIKGDATFTARVDAPAPHHESGLHVALWAGHFAPRVYLRLDDDGVVRCTMRRQDTRDAMAYLRLAQLCPEVPWVQATAAGKLAVLGLHAEAFPLFERLLDRDIAGSIQGYVAWPLVTSYFEAGREDELARRMLQWQPTPEMIAKEEVPMGGYASVAGKLAEKKKWELSLQVAHHAMQWSVPKDYTFRGLALQAVKALEAMSQKDALSAVILDGLFGKSVDESRGKPGTAPPQWMHTGGGGGDDGPSCPSLELLYAAQENQCGAVVWQTIRKIVPSDSKEPLDRMDRVLAGIAAQDAAVLGEWRSLMDGLKEEYHSAGEEYFYTGAGKMLERWKGHDREAMETWLTAAYIGTKRRMISSQCGGWERDLFMGEGAVRCALKVGDIEQARRTITVLNERFVEFQGDILKEAQFIEPGMRILQMTLDQKHLELTRLFIETMDTLISKSQVSYTRRHQEQLSKIKRQMAEGK